MTLTKQVQEATLEESSIKKKSEFSVPIPGIYGGCHLAGSLCNS